MDKILIDTDVILDFFFDRKPFSENATKILTLCEKGKIKAYITPVIISNLYYLLRKTANHKKVIEKLKQLLQIIDVLQINRTIVINALNSNFKDFEDALQNFSAINNKDIKIIVTRNTKDFKKSKIGVFSPESFLKIISLTE